MMDCRDKTILAIFIPVLMVFLILGIIIQKEITERKHEMARIQHERDSLLWEMKLPKYNTPGRRVFKPENLPFYDKEAATDAETY